MSKVPQNAAGFFTCSICSREFSGLNSLKKHMPIHTRRVQHSCDVCGHVFGKREYLMDHARRHTGDASPTCEVSTYMLVVWYLFYSQHILKYFVFFWNCRTLYVEEVNNMTKLHIICGIF